MRPEEFLDFAAELANSNTSGSAAHRSAVSRSYYGVYHAVRSAIEKGLSISCRADSGGNEHKLVVDYLAGSQVDEAAEIARLLRNLSQSRKEADYDLDDKSAESQQNSQACVARGRNILEKLNACVTGPLRQKVIAGITQYRKLRTTGR